MLKLEESNRMEEEAKHSLAGGVCSSMKLNAKPQLYAERAKGSRIFDVDGNEYIDYKMGAGPMILGHSSQMVIDTVKDQLDRGIVYGRESPLGIEVSRCLVELIPCADLVRFTNSGSEANHLAIRLARAHRGRPKIIRFEGHYHGWFDNIYTPEVPDMNAIGPRKARQAVPATAGQGRAIEDAIVMPWSDLEMFERTVTENPDDIAGVIMVPIMFGTGGGAFPREGFLQGVRDICKKNDIVLIFDEIITGFRVAKGGSQELFGVLPDIATYAKAIAAGMPLGAVAGRKEIMEQIASGKVKHHGTYNGNPLCLAGAKAALAELTKNDGEFYRHCNRLRELLTEGILNSAEKHGVPAHVSGAGAIMQVWLTENVSYHDYRESRKGFKSDAQSKLVSGLLARNILCGSMIFITSAHTVEDVDITLQAIDEVMESL